MYKQKTKIENLDFHSNPLKQNAHRSKWLTVWSIAKHPGLYTQTEKKRPNRNGCSILGKT